MSLDTPRETRRQLLARPEFDPDAFGRASEQFARFMGTGRFLVYMTAFVAFWAGWNTLAPAAWRFDSYPFIFLTLVLSLQASYAAPLILLAQNRQDDRDRVLNEQDRSRDERALADTEYLTREVAALRIALRDVATRDFVRSELRSILEELADEGVTVSASPSRDAKRKGNGKKRKRVPSEAPAVPASADSGPEGDLPTPAG
ncbi:putative membrane protein [Kineococcus rhizosphaerae]|uniref:Putative membrane protein n=1 Tax=Kineococcus rhizosphaerae TaxID=559628 RepID=A0A2T0R465_9ACTN|nr:putative membrane protein [Kineococcus rhizosphaerae]